MSRDHMIKGRSLRPSVCSCEHGCVSREEMAKRHGSPDKFLRSLVKAFGDGYVSFAEAEFANLKYREEWAAAPEKTEVGKP
jgi:hypothetical protein